MFWSPYGRPRASGCQKRFFAERKMLVHAPVPDLSCSAPITRTKVHVGGPLCSEKPCSTSLVRQKRVQLETVTLPSHNRLEGCYTITIDFVLCTRQLRIGAGQTQQWFYSCLTGNAIEFSLLCSKRLLRVASSFLSGIYHCDNVHTETALFWTAFVTASDHC